MGMFTGAIIIIIGTCIQAPSVNRGMFLGGRFLLGFGVSFCCVSAPCYVSEMAHPAWRGTITGLYNCTWYMVSPQKSCTRLRRVLTIVVVSSNVRMFECLKALSLPKVGVGAPLQIATPMRLYLGNPRILRPQMWQGALSYNCALSSPGCSRHT